MKSIYRISNLIQSLVLLLIVSLVSVQASAAVLEEIIVTAQKREQNLQDVGVAVTAFTGQQMKELGVLSTIDLVAQTPGLNSASAFGEGNNATFIVRGVGLNDFSEISESGAAVYIDEVYQATLAGLGFQLFDMERAEVLKGPQGTLFGRNASAGLVHFITRKPTQDLNAYSEITVGEYDQFRLEGAVGGGLSENVSGRFSFLYHNHDGYRESRLPGVDDGSSTNMYALRAKLLFTPNDKLEILANVHGSQADQVATTYEHTVVDYAADGATKILVPIGGVNSSCAGFSTPGTDCYGYRDTDGDVRASDNDREPFLILDTAGVSVKVDYDITGALQLTSITAGEYINKSYGEDTDMGPRPGVLVTNPVDNIQWSEEIRLAGQRDKLQWTTGFYYFYRDIDSGTRTDISAPEPFNISIGQPNIRAVNHLQTNSWALFANGEYALNEQWSLVAGIRYTEEESKYKLQNYLDSDPGSPLIFEFSEDTVGSLARHDKSNVSYRVELDWHANQDAMLYGAVSTGVKAAGFNTNLGFSDAQIPFDEEDLTSYEMGLKSMLFDGAARFNAAVFYYDYQDYQAFSFQGLTNVARNKDATVKGFEAELSANPWDGWEFMFGLGLLDTNAEDIDSERPFIGGAIIRDRELSLAPKVTFNGLARYERPMFDGMMSIQGDFSYTGEQYFDIDNNPVSLEDSYVVSNAHLSYMSGDGHWQLKLSVKNFTDEDYRVYAVPTPAFCGCGQNMYGKPRWVSGTVTYNW